MKSLTDTNGFTWFEGDLVLFEGRYGIIKDFASLSIANVQFPGKIQPMFLSNLTRVTPGPALIADDEKYKMLDEILEETNKPMSTKDEFEAWRRGERPRIGDRLEL